MENANEVKEIIVSNELEEMQAILHGTLNIPVVTEVSTSAPVPSSFPEASDASVTETGTVVKPTKDGVKGASQSIYGFGKQAGQQVASAAGVLQNTIRGMLCSTAETLLGKADEQDVWLKGYAEGLSDKFKPNSINTMKSEAKRVFKAWAIGAHTMTVGIDSVTKTPIQETKSGREWLMQYEGKFQGFMELARVIVDGRGAPKAKLPPKRMSEVAQEKTKGLIEVATPNQVQDIAERAVEKATPTAAKVIAFKALEVMAKDRHVGWEVALLIQIENLATTLAESEDKAIQADAYDISNIVEARMLEIEKKAALAKTSLVHESESTIVQTAHGVEYETPAVETQQQAAVG